MENLSLKQQMAQMQHKEAFNSRLMEDFEK